MNSGSVSLESVRRSSKVALIWRGTPEEQRDDPFKKRERRFRVGEALKALGMQPEALLFREEQAEEFEAALGGFRAALVWVNPIENDRSRAELNGILARAAEQGLVLGADPGVIGALGVKEVLYHTRHLPFGSDVSRVSDPGALEAALAADLAAGRSRVVKRNRSQSGQDVWRVSPLASGAEGGDTGQVGVQAMVQAALRGSEPRSVRLADFVAEITPFFGPDEPIIVQAWQERLGEGMIRCYMVGDRVEGFGHQLVNLLCPPEGSNGVPLPTARYYLGPSHPEFQRLKRLLEEEWMPLLLEAVNLPRERLPALWDADFLLGPKEPDGSDRYVLCEINASCVDPFPDEVVVPLAHYLVKQVRMSA